MNDFHTDREQYEVWLYEYTSRNPNYRAQMERLASGGQTFHDFLSDVIDIECSGVDIYRCRFHNQQTGAEVEETYRPYLAPTVKAVTSSETGRLLFEKNLSATPERRARDESVAIARACGQPMPEGYETGQYDIKTIRERPRATALPLKEDDCRILGLWLWDYCDQNGVGVTTAIKALRQTTTPYRDIADGRKTQDIDDRQLKRYFRRTRECIEACEVLPFTS